MGDNHRIKIYIVNLKKSHARRNEMIRKMDAAGLQYEFFDAVDGNELPDVFLNKIRNQPYSFKKAFGRDMTVGEIGCAMSHLHVYEKIVTEKIELALVLEDDIDFDERLQFVVNNHKTAEVLQNKLDLVLLGYCTNDQAYRKRAEMSLHKRRKIGNDIFFAIPVIWYWSTIGYFISNSGAKKLLPSGTMPRMPSDFLTANSPKYGVRLGISNTPIVWPGEMNDISHIGGGRGHPGEKKNDDEANGAKDNKGRGFTEGLKQAYRGIRTRYHKARKIAYKQYLKIAPSDYLYVSDRF